MPRIVLTWGEFKQIAVEALSAKHKCRLGRMTFKHVGGDMEFNEPSGQPIGDVVISILKDEP